MIRNPTSLLYRLTVPAVLVLALSWSASAQKVLPQETSVKLDVPYVPTRHEVVQRMLEIAEVGKGDYVIDLGSGDGRIPIAAVKAGADRALGVDINPQRIKEANENAEQEGVTDRVTFRQENLFETPIADATVITMYLLPTVNLQLRPRLLDELRPGTRIVSHSFHMENWKPDAQDEVEHSQVYFWIIPAKVGGRWEVTDGDRTFTIALSQDFQEFAGTASIDGKEVPLSKTQLRGDKIQFVVEENDGKPVKFTGKTQGNQMEGQSDNGKWTAKRLAT